MESDLPAEVGPAGRLLKGNVDIFWALLQHTPDLELQESQKRALRDEFTGLYFWADGYFPYGGLLDEVLANSSRLRQRVLSVLTEVGEILTDEHTGLFALVCRSTKDEQLGEQRMELIRLLEGIRGSISDSFSDSDSVSTDSTRQCDADDIINELRVRNRCLKDIGLALEHPAPDASVVEAKKTAAPESFTVVGPAEIWTRKVLDTFPRIDHRLASRLGEANWKRYQKISKKLAELEAMDLTAEDSDDSSENEEKYQLGEMHDVSAYTKSTSGEQSLFSRAHQSSSGYGATTATSMSQRAINYRFPIPRRRLMARDAASQATFTSTVTDDQGERGWLKIPPMPIEESELGNTFRCTICGEKQTEILSRSDWKKHCFVDLEPYICTINDCSMGLSQFATRRAWANHELVSHRSGRSLECPECKTKMDDPFSLRWHLSSVHYRSEATGEKIQQAVAKAVNLAPQAQDDNCPFCREQLKPGIRTFAMHVARHMEEVALAVLPRDNEPEHDYGSIASDESIAQMTGDAPDPGPKGNPNSEQEPSKNKWDPENFNLLAVIGKGNYGKVVLMQSKHTKQLYATKSMKKEMLVTNSETEVAGVEKLALRIATEQGSPFIAKLYGTFHNSSRVYFYMEYYRCGDLMQHIQKGQFGRKRVQFYTAEICLAIKWMHEQGIIYRDMTLENILLTPDGHIKLVDFGLVKFDMWYGRTTGTFCGTVEFMAPELLLDQPYDRSVDFWTLGVLMYQMHFQQSPFRGEDENEIYDSILGDEPLYPLHTPPDVLSVLRGLLTREREQRLGAGPTGVAEVMEHLYFATINWDDLYHKRMPPPFIPTDVEETDTSYFDDEFTSLPKVFTPVTTEILPEQQVHFRGFEWSLE